MAALKHTATPSPLTQEQRTAIVDELYNVDAGCAAMRVLIRDLRSFSPVPLEGDSGMEIGVTLGALVEAIAAAGNRLGVVLDPCSIAAESGAAHG